LSIKGQEVFARALSRLPFEVDEEVVRVIDEAVTAEFQRQRAEIPFYEGKPYTDKYGRHGGPLRNSLTSTTDAFHQAGVVGNTVEVRSLVDYAKYNTLPEPDERAVEVALLGLLMDRLREGGGR
jgi:hypothetical protein